MAQMRADIGDLAGTSFETVMTNPGREAIPTAQRITEISREVFRKHGAQHLDTVSMLNRDLDFYLRDGKRMLPRELRSPFVRWVVSNQAEFDIIGGEAALTEAEVVKVIMEILLHFFSPHCCVIRVNHRKLRAAIWSWIGVMGEDIKKVAKELKLTKEVIYKLLTIGVRFCKPAEQTLPTLRREVPQIFKEALPSAIEKALDELSVFSAYLGVRSNVYVDLFMAPTEGYHSDLFFQVYLTKKNDHKALTEGALLASGGRYDYVFGAMWDKEHKSNCPGAVGASLSLETVIKHSLVEPKPTRTTPAKASMTPALGSQSLKAPITDQ